MSSSNPLQDEISAQTKHLSSLQSQFQSLKTSFFSQINEVSSNKVNKHRSLDHDFLSEGLKKGLLTAGNTLLGESLKRASLGKIQEKVEKTKRNAQNPSNSKENSSINEEKNEIIAEKTEEFNENAANSQEKEESPLKNSNSSQNIDNSAVEKLKETFGAKLSLLSHELEKSIAEKTQLLHEEMRLLKENTLLFKENQAINQELKKILTEKDRISAEKDKSIAELAKEKQEKQKIIEELSSKNLQTKSMQEHLEDLSPVFEKLKSENEAISQQNEELLNKLQEKTKENQELLKNQQNLLDSKTLLTSENTFLTQRLEELDSQLKSLQQNFVFELEEKNQKLAALEQKFCSKTNETEDFQQKINVFLEKEAEQSANFQSLLSEKLHLERENQNLRRENRKFIEDLLEKDEKLKEMCKEKEALVDRYQIQRNKLIYEYKELATKCEELEKELKGFKLDPDAMKLRALNEKFEAFEKLKGNFDMKILAEKRNECVIQ